MALSHYLYTNNSVGLNPVLKAVTPNREKVRFEKKGDFVHIDMEELISSIAVIITKDYMVKKA